MKRNSYRPGRRKVYSVPPVPVPKTEEEILAMTNLEEMIEEIKKLQERNEEERKSKGA